MYDMYEPSRFEGMLLLQQAWSQQKHGRYSEALSAAEGALNVAQQLANLGMEIRAAGIIASTLELQGNHAAAHAQYEWILAVARDPMRQSAIEHAHVEKVITMAYMRSVDTALFLPDVELAPLSEMLDTADAYVRMIGKPEWRAGLLHQRARLLEALGSVDAALDAAEQGLHLELQHGSAPGATLAAHQLTFGNLLRQVRRYAEAAVQYKAVLIGKQSTPHERIGACVGLARCHLGTNDLETARRCADDARRFAEEWGDELLSLALNACTDAYLAIEDVVEARKASDRAVECARRMRSSYRLYFALRNAAKVALAEHDAARAHALLDEAVPYAAAFDRVRNCSAQRDQISSLRMKADCIAPRVVESGEANG